MSKYFYWLLLITSFALFGAISTPDKGVTYLQISDRKAKLDSSWRIIELPRYNDNRSIFTKHLGALATFPFPYKTFVTGLSLRVYDYGKGKNTVAVHVGNIEKKLSFEGKHKGVTKIVTEFEQPVEADSIRVETVKIGQSSFVLDSVTIIAEDQFDWIRIFGRAAMMALLAGVIWLASLLIVAPTTSSGRAYVSIDLFRGIAVLLVILLHSTGYAALPDLSAQPVFDLLVKNGHFGVELFYIVSAFTLTHSLFALSSRGIKADEKRIGIFWYRRFTRIYPIFFAVLILALILGDLTQPKGEEISWSEILYRYLTMSYIFDREILIAPIGHTVWWSISTEFQFYILMPLAVLPLTDILVSHRIFYGPFGRCAHAIIALMLIVLGILLAAHTRDQLSGKPWLVYTLFYHLDAFIVGVGLSIVMWRSKILKSEVVPGNRTVR